MALWPTISAALPAKCGGNFNFRQRLTPITYHRSTIFKSSLSFKSSSNCCCIKNEIPAKHVQGFSVLSSDIPWDGGSVWSTMAMYLFFLHIPLGVGGMSTIAYVLHRSVLDPKTEVLSLLILQVIELTGTMLLLRSTAKSEFELKNIFKTSKLTKERNWLLSSAVGFGFLVVLVFLTSILADSITGSKAVNNPVVKEILASSDDSKVACLLVYCCITPLLEETVYRVFLLRSLSSTMKWQHAVLLSSAVFSVAHFSVENSLQLFIIGCVLGCCYTWSGNFGSSIAVHSLYNAMTLIITFLS